MLFHKRVFSRLVRWHNPSHYCIVFTIFTAFTVLPQSFLFRTPYQTKSCQNATNSLSYFSSVSKFFISNIFFCISLHKSKISTLWAQEIDSVLEIKLSFNKENSIFLPRPLFQSNSTGPYEEQYQIHLESHFLEICPCSMYLSLLIFTRIITYFLSLKTLVTLTAKSLHSQASKNQNAFLKQLRSLTCTQPPK